MSGRNFSGNRLPLGLGIAFWLGLLGWLLVASNEADQSGGAGVISSKVADYVLDLQARFALETDGLFVSMNDPVFVRTEEGGWKQIGHITDSGGNDGSVIASWYGNRAPRHFRFRYHRSQGSLEQAVATLLPPSKRAVIREKLASATQAHQRELGRAFEPVVTSLLKESVPIIVNGVTRSLQRHRDIHTNIIERYEREVLKRRLMPLAKAELLPAIKEHGAPVAKEIGYELWERASLWRFGWRMAHDKLPLTGRNLVEEEWERFVEEEAVPVFEKHTSSLLRVVNEVAQDVSSSDRVRRELAEVAREMLADEELKQLMGRVFDEAIVENARLHEVWYENWHSKRTEAALELTMKRLEPLVKEIGDEILGSRETGITPEFARVLRRQVLGKDRRWIVAERRVSPLPKGATLQLHKAERPGAYPLVHLASQSGAEMLGVSR